MAASAPFTPTGSIRSLAYRVLWRCAGTLQKVANGCLYFSAGLLRQHDLQTASAARWNTFATSIDEVDGGLDAWERRVYQEVLNPAERVLIVGCGAGRDLIALRALGYELTGLDVSPTITGLARTHLARRGMTADVQTGFIEQLDPGGPYGAVVFSGRCYGCIQGVRTRQATLARLRTSLTPTGRILITYAVPEHDAAAATRLTDVATRLTRAGWHPEPGDRFTCDYLAPRVLRYEHLFEQDDIARECGEAGFRVLGDEEIRGSFRWLVAAPDERTAATD